MFSIVISQYFIAFENVKCFTSLQKNSIRTIIYTDFSFDFKHNGKILKLELEETFKCHFGYSRATELT